MRDRVTNILLVEDDEVDVMNVKRTFNKHHFSSSLYVAENGIKALEMLKSQNKESPIVPENRRLILLDLNMPRMNGLEFLTQLRKDNKLKKIPVIILTTSNEDRDKIEAYNLNVAGYILKPVNFTHFVEMVVALNNYWALCEIA